MAASEGSLRLGIIAITTSFLLLLSLSVIVMAEVFGSILMHKRSLPGGNPDPISFCPVIVIVPAEVYPVSSVVAGESASQPCTSVIRIRGLSGPTKHRKFTP